MNPIEVHNYLMRQHRNVYQEAQLFEQNRKDVRSYLDILSHPFFPDQSLTYQEGKLVAENGDGFLVKNNVIDFRNIGTNDSELHKKWTELNKFLVNYQQYLTPYVLINTLSMYNYIGEKTGLNLLKDATVVDIGAGTGQIYGTFFYHQESINYYLVDPNLRLIHDHFLRLYPKLVHYPLSHLLCYAENLPFKSSTADLVMSISSIDHFKDYKQFMAEAYRILKPGGHILIASHLDEMTVEDPKPKVPAGLNNNVPARSFINKVYNRLNLKFERYASRFHNKKRGKVLDDHMHHFENTLPMEEALEAIGFEIEQAEVFNYNFFIKAKKK